MSHQPLLAWDQAALTSVCAHNGVGLLKAARVVDRDRGALAFVDQVLVPSGVTIGSHTHGQDEELYVIVSGIGEVTVDGEISTVGPGDVVHNRAGGTHGLRNLGHEPLRMVVVDLRIAGA